MIGGIALQVWGEPRVTGDVDVSVMTAFGSEAETASLILTRISARADDPIAFAMKNRVLLCESIEGIGIDIGLASFPYEEEALARRQRVALVPGVVIPVIGPEDLVTMKVFAGRPRDWEDVRGVVVRQGDRLDWSIIERNLPFLLELIEEPERMDRLFAMRDEASKL